MRRWIVIGLLGLAGCAAVESLSRGIRDGVTGQFTIADAGEARVGMLAQPGESSLDVWLYGLGGILATSGAFAARRLFRGK